jgi:hypothetical protein
MIANLLTPITHNDKALHGISRSRLSLHFNTARKRRWLLVQLVSAPALPDPAADQPDQPTPYAYTAPNPERTDYNHLMDSFQASRIATRCI